jgi:hypothetical protein
MLTNIIGLIYIDFDVVDKGILHENAPIGGIK